MPLVSLELATIQSKNPIPLDGNSADGKVWSKRHELLQKRQEHSRSVVLKKRLGRSRSEIATSRVVVKRTPASNQFFIMCIYVIEQLRQNFGTDLGSNSLQSLSVDGTSRRALE